MTSSSAKTTENPLSDLLTYAARELDLPPKMRSVLRGIYRRAEKHLRENLPDHADWQVYPQGSVSLGTVVKPTTKVDYDLDAVIKSSKRKDQLTQAELKRDVGDVVKGFYEAERSGPLSPKELGEGKRCWTISYDGVHVDWLPAISDPETTTGSGILLTDRDLTCWQHGDPQCYAGWFRQQQSWEDFLLRKELAALEANVQVADFPDDEVRTTLQRLVQVLKIHRNETFSETQRLQPPSIIVTHLAALSYGGTSSLIDELSDAADRMSTFMRKEAGTWSLRNPVQEKENFADRWTDQHQKAFLQWTEKLRADIDALDHLPSGFHHQVARLGESFGVDTITKAAAHLGHTTTSMVNAGVTGVTSSGLVTRTKPRTILRPHEFHGTRRTRG